MEEIHVVPENDRNEKGNAPTLGEPSAGATAEPFSERPFSADESLAAARAALGSPREFSAGACLAQGLSAFAKAPLFFLFLSILGTAPRFFHNFFSRPGPSLASPFLMRIVMEMLARLFQGCIAYGVYQILMGQKIRFTTAFSRGFSRIVALFLASLCITLLTGLGLLLLVIPGIIMGCAWFVTVPACVVEGLGPVASMRRSAELTHGRRGSIFGILFFWFIVALALSLVSDFILSALAARAMERLVVQMGRSVVMNAYLGILSATVYYDLRVAKEGVSVDKLANVFD